MGNITIPMFTVTLQRDTVEVGGNAGILSIGELPGGVKNESLTWVPVRTYSKAESRLSPPLDSPNEVCPRDYLLIEIQHDPHSGTL